VRGHFHAPSSIGRTETPLPLDSRTAPRCESMRLNTSTTAASTSSSKLSTTARERPEAPMRISP